MTMTEILVDDNPSVSADVNLAVAAGETQRFVGISIRELEGSEFYATCRIINGSIASGTPILSIELATSDSKFIWCWPGIDAEDGISIEHIRGDLEIQLYYVVMR